MRNIISKILFALLVLTMGIGQMWGASSALPTSGTLNNGVVKYELSNATTVVNNSKIYWATRGSVSKDAAYGLRPYQTGFVVSVSGPVKLTFNVKSNTTSARTITGQAYVMSDALYYVWKNTSASSSLEDYVKTVNAKTAANRTEEEAVIAANSKLKNITSSSDNNKKLLTGETADAALETAHRRAISHACPTTKGGTNSFADTLSAAGNYLIYLTSSGGSVGLTTIDVDPLYPVRTSLANITKTSGDTLAGATGSGNADYTAVFAASEGYVLPSTITVTIGGATATLNTHYTWNSSTGVFTVVDTKATGVITVTISGEAAGGGSPIDPTLMYNAGAYTIGGSALDLSSLIASSNSSGAITYAVKTDGDTHASIEGTSFTATAAGTCVVTASQAAVSGIYNAKSVDFNVVVSAPAATHSVTAATEDANKGTAAATDAIVAEGATTTIAANPKSGYVFDHWTVSGTGATLNNASANPVTLTMGTADATVTAYFTEKTCPTSGEIYSLIMKSAALSSVTQNTEVALATDYATDKDGTSYLGNKNSDATKAQIKTDGSGTIYFNGNDAYVKIVLDCQLKTGDLIAITNGSGTKEVCFTTTNTRATTYSTSSQSYECAEAFNNVSTIYVWRVDGGTYMHSLTITRPAPVCPSGLTISGTTTYTEGDKIELTAALTAGNGDITYQWYKGSVALGNEIAGATSTKLEIADCALSDGGDYFCVASKTSCADAVNASACTVTVNPAPATGTIDDLVEISSEYSYIPTESLVTNTLYDGDKLISIGDGNNYSSGGIRIKENRALAFKVAANAKVIATFNENGNIEMQLGTATTDDDNKAYGHSKTSPKEFDVIPSAGVVYLTASNDLYLTKLEIKYPHNVTYQLGDGTGTQPIEDAHYVGEKFNLHDGTTNITAPYGKEFAGWNDGTTTYAGGAQYTMPATAVTLTAQWTTPLPEPTVTFNDGAYTVGGSALDLSTLFTSNSEGVVTYSVKTAGETGATIDGSNFTATAAGSAVITASQAPTASYKAKSVDATITISEPSEVDGIKLVEAGDLTGNFRTSLSLTELSSGNKYTIAGLDYTKYIKFGSSVSSWSAVAGPSNKYLSYTPTKETTNFYFYVHNNSSASYINLYLIEEGNITPTKVQIAVAANANVLKTYELNITKNTEVYITAESNNVYYCQVVAVESGNSLKKAPDVGYEMNLNKGRLSTASATATTLDGLSFYLGSGYSIASSANATIGTKGTHYISFIIPDGQTRQLQLTTSNTNKYTISQTKGDDANQITPTANEAKTFNLIGNGNPWYINPQGSNVQVTNIAFAEAPALYTVTFDANGGSLVDEQKVWTGEKATEPADPTYDGYDFVGWFNGAATEPYDFNSTVTGDVELTAHWTVHVTNNAKLATLSYGGNAIDLEDGIYTYNINLPHYTTAVPALAATTEATIVTSKTITDAANFDANNEATSTVVVVSEDGTATLTYTVNFKVVTLYTLQDVTGEIEWVFTGTKAVDANVTTLADKDTVLANVQGIKNNSEFNAQALMVNGKGVYVNNYIQAYKLKFHTTVPGKVTVVFSNTNDKENYRYLVINGVQTTARSKSKELVTYNQVVPSGDVELTVTNADGGQYFNFRSLAFTPVLGPEQAEESTLGGYERATTEGRYGTICLPNGGVMVGADLFEVAYYGATSQKIFFDQIMNGEMEAGIPYIFLPKEGVSQLGVYYTDAAGSTAGNRNGLYGSYSEQVLEKEAGNYVLYNNQYLYVGDESTNVKVGANRAYIKLAEITPIEPALAPGRRRVSMGVIGAPQVTTGVGELNADETPIKVMIDGQLYIIRGEKMYDATGRLVK